MHKYIVQRGFRIRFLINFGEYYLNYIRMVLRSALHMVKLIADDAFNYAISVNFCRANNLRLKYCKVFVLNDLAKVERIR